VGQWRVHIEHSQSDDLDPDIHCDRCQAVCCQLPVILLPGDDPPEEFIDVDDDGAEIMGKADDGWCAALDRGTMRCSIYARRPWVCREFEMGGHDCRSVRADWRRIAITLR
jgi:uncharacterized protein